MRLTRILAAAALAGAAFATTPASALDVAPTCPSGSQGVVVSHGGSSTFVCTTAVRDVQKAVADVHLNYSCEICPPK